MVRVAVIRFPGTNCDLEMAWAVKLAGGDPEFVWHEDGGLDDFDAVIIPGGFTYGDYIRAGAIAALSPILEEIRECAEDGRPVLGVCNGMQILAEAELIPGTLTVNVGNRFICDWVYLRVERTDTPFTTKYQEDEVIRVPIAHAEGRYYYENPEEIEDNVVFRFCGPDGDVSEEYNLNGSVGGITGVVNDDGNVLGMMPHPERAAHRLLNSDDGLRLFESLVEWCRS
ncbi:phosphoribosylformylglycinamidine synthase I [Methanopyrus kandleri]|uniref:Phosphoribosylformylglycinamidine synthase subunit PurQ n=2 Tax=Methanopyrus kandleri TaxID=2320 RepID=PURQ_METKA|nr:RecName: Full=Phosphoribosylformylglycinamidine synthase subunit PurQ; Short=FGAM synthase; AltName: Full=Formylglycinamide ribonucleotide amidotransferase subunit I; Short=FGAR amidotransferase I; Short=FGAR-AT I; AltName: Full=Glutaminase PurQ; AltName: Full=Phosphoribosylformylglycinamidine synthase subunit I [Methanopyrus kandleri AV19]AAM02004.1 Phosphoribosylformylglycinamidine (FGAM) synthase, glutamine amidotransferase subunit [Methanopyrus kandleri AV19]HII69981.1 phosphoribosylformyl